MVTMQGYTIDLDELATSWKLIGDHADSFGNIRVALGPEDSNRPWSGGPPAATKLSRASHDLHVAARTQFSAAHEFLRRVGQELVKEGRRTAETEIANVDAIRRVSATLR